MSSFVILFGRASRANQCPCRDVGPDRFRRREMTPALATIANPIRDRKTPTVGGRQPPLRRITRLPRAQMKTPGGCPPGISRLSHDQPIMDRSYAASGRTPTKCLCRRSRRPQAVRSSPPPPPRRCRRCWCASRAGRDRCRAAPPGSTASGYRSARSSSSGLQLLPTPGVKAVNVAPAVGTPAQTAAPAAPKCELMMLRRGAVVLDVDVAAVDRRPPPRVPDVLVAGEGAPHPGLLDRCSVVEHAVRDPPQPDASAGVVARSRSCCWSRSRQHLPSSRSWRRSGRRRRG